MSLMLNVANKPFMLSVFILNVVMLNVVAPSIRPVVNIKCAPLRVGSRLGHKERERERESER